VSIQDTHQLLSLSGQPTSALARTAMGGLLTMSRWLKLEMLGALGPINVKPDPAVGSCRRSSTRCGAPAGAYPFHDVHAEVDPRHGKDWLDDALAPTVTSHPEWSPADRPWSALAQRPNRSVPDRRRALTASHRLTLDDP